MTNRQHRLAMMAAAVVALALGLALTACVPVTVQIAPTSTEPPQVTETPGPTEEPAMAEVPAPIDRVEILVAESFPPQYFLLIVSGLPNSCTQFDRFEVTRQGKAIDVEVINLEPVGAVCADVYGTVEHNVPLGSDFEPGGTYSVKVNDVAKTLIAQGSIQERELFITALNRPFQLALGQSAMVNPQGPIVEFVEVVEDSRCPLGATCVWAGRATVLVNASSLGDVLGFGVQALTLEAGRLDLAASTVKGTYDTYLIECIALDPYPQLTSEDAPQPQPDYIATFVVSRVETGIARAATSAPTGAPTSAPSRVPSRVPASTPTSTPTPTPVCTVRTDWIRYTVARGDTLFNIAWRSGSSVDALMVANCLEGTQIIVGQTLYVPAPVAPLETPTPQPIWFYLIMPGDNGQSGPPVGCGDSAVAVRSARSSTGSLEGDIRASLEELFSIRTIDYGQSGYTHSLHAANLVVQTVTVGGGRAVIRLTGALPLVGVCADAQMEAQIRLTLFQYGGFDSAMITLDGTNLKQLFDVSGTVGNTDPYRR